MPVVGNRQYVQRVFSLMIIPLFPPRSRLASGEGRTLEDLRFEVVSSHPETNDDGRGHANDRASDHGYGRASGHVNDHDFDHSQFHVEWPTK